MGGVQRYNAAGQMTQMGSETRTYNAMGQLTNITVPGSMNITCNYSSTQNNGKITSQVDSLTGEQVTYAYDSLNRLISAQAGTSWGQGFVYDPFGNLTDKNVLAGLAPPLHVVINAANNHAGGEDLNGNAGGMTWDTENRLTSVPAIAPTIIVRYSLSYAYDGQNKRMWANTPTVDQISGDTSDSEHYSFYGADGKLMAQFTPVYSPRAIGAQASLTWQYGPTRLYFGSRLLGNEDRLGSRGKYFPYGEDRTSPASPPNDNVKFATYTRDSATGLDYADQRYYASTFGRFITIDPTPPSKSDPETWNRYSYATGDPANGNDPSGLLTIIIGGFANGNPDWGQPCPDLVAQGQSCFNSIVSDTFGEQAQVFPWSGYGVSAADGYIGLTIAAGQLADYINSYGFKPNEPLNIVGFSEGGNVALMAVYLGLNHEIDNLVNLGTPQNWDIYPIEAIHAAKNYCAVSSLADWVQFVGASPFQIVTFFEATYDASLSEAYAWEAFLAGDWSGYLYYTALAAYNTSVAAYYWLSTKIDIWADHNVLLTSESHFDLHTVGVWNGITKDCGLKK